MLEIGSLIDGKYKILNEVGHGGMSVGVSSGMDISLRL